MTQLDQVHAAMLADPEDDGARLRYYRCLADVELFLLLNAEASGETMEPQLFPLADGPVVLAFDSEERLAEFTGTPSPYAALPGRVIMAQLKGQETGLGVNLGSEAAWLMAPYAVDWLAGLLEARPAETRGRPTAISRPEVIDPDLAEALAVAVSGAGGLAAAAVLAEAAWADGGRGLLLAYLGAKPEAEEQLARALAEAMAFSGYENGMVDVLFLGQGDPSARALLALGQPLTLPEPPKEKPAPPPPAPPGMNPDLPPRLR